MSLFKRPHGNKETGVSMRARARDRHLHTRSIGFLMFGVNTYKHICENLTRCSGLFLNMRACVAWALVFRVLLWRRWKEMGPDGPDKVQGPYRASGGMSSAVTASDFESPHSVNLISSHSNPLGGHSKSRIHKLAVCYLVQAVCYWSSSCHAAYKR